MSEVLDIRKIPANELQTREGGEVLTVYDCPQFSEDSCNRVLVVSRKGTTILHYNVATNGEFAWGDNNHNIIRKKKLKGRVLYRGNDNSLYVTGERYTQQEFECQFPQRWTFIRILTEVPEFPTEEV